MNIIVEGGEVVANYAERAGAAVVQNVVHAVEEKAQGFINREAKAAEDFLERQYGNVRGWLRSGRERLLPNRRQREEVEVPMAEEELAVVPVLQANNVRRVKRVRVDQNRPRLIEAAYSDAVAARRTIPLVEWYKRPQNVAEAVIYQNMVYYRKRGRSSYGVRGRRRRFKNRYRMNKRRRYCTKKGVKMLINKMAAFDSKFTKLKVVDSEYWGYVVAGVPTIRYGYVERGFLAFSDLAAINAALAVVDANSVAKTGGYNEANNYRYCFKKFSIKILMHNPITEDVIATFWWCKVKDSWIYDPVTLWEGEYTQKVDSAISGAFNRQFSTSPTEYKEWNNYYEIGEKFKTVFKPGETKTMRLDHKGFYHQVNDSSNENYQVGKTHVLMWQLHGVPSHENTGGAQTDNVTFSPAALDIIYTYNREAARSSSVGKLENTTNNLPSITSGYSLNDVAGQVYASV